PLPIGQCDLRHSCWLHPSQPFLIRYLKYLLQGINTPSRSSNAHSTLTITPKPRLKPTRWNPRAAMHEDLAGVDLKPEGRSLVPFRPIGGIYLMGRRAFSASCRFIPAPSYPIRHQCRLGTSHAFAKWG